MSARKLDQAKPVAPPAPWWSVTPDVVREVKAWFLCGAALGLGLGLASGVWGAFWALTTAVWRTVAR